MPPRARTASLPAAWPLPADPDAASRLRQRFGDLDTAGSPGLPPEVEARVLDALGGNSPYLADLALREAGTLRQVLGAGPDAAVADALAALTRMSASAPRAAVAAALRQAKRRVALAVALADLGGSWSLEQVTAALSDLAEAALGLSCAHLLRAAHDKRALRLPNPEQPARNSGWIVLGMGKLGARELNYSSDVDLILLYDPDRHAYHDGGLAALFSRLARDLVTLMEARDADGYVFRTDLRLRPDPASTPPCVALPAALTYYESMGQNWERAAMIKARPVAGDLDAGARFLAEIRPFVWRRGLDFAAIADIHAMKARVDQHKRTALAQGRDPAAQLLGHDVKLGQGGIREIEFLTQTLQMVWGGRDPGLRLPRTLQALPALAKAGRLAPDAVPELDAAYRALRRIEHRLQMVADRQTHSLPAQPPEFRRFAIFMGYTDEAAFARDLLAHMERGGVRALVAVSGGRARIIDARGNDVSVAYPELRPLGQALGSRAVLLDGEIVALGKDGRPDSRQLRRRPAKATAPQAKTVREAAVTYLAFDLLHLDGHPTTELPYEERRALLEEVTVAGPRWSVAPRLDAGSDAVRASGISGSRAWWPSGSRRRTRAAGARTGGWSTVGGSRSVDRRLGRRRRRRAARPPRRHAHRPRADLSRHGPVRPQRRPRRAGPPPPPPRPQDVSFRRCRAHPFVRAVGPSVDHRCHHDHRHADLVPFHVKHTAVVHVEHARW